MAATTARCSEGLTENDGHEIGGQDISFENRLHYNAVCNSFQNNLTPLGAFGASPPLRLDTPPNRNTGYATACSRQYTVRSTPYTVSRLLHAVCCLAFCVIISAAEWNRHRLW